MTGIKTVTLLALVLAFEMTLSAEQRKYVIGSSVSIVSGETNNANLVAINQPQSSRPFSYFYSLDPSINMGASGPTDSFNVSYSLGFNRTKNASTAESTSHQASMTFSKPGPKWKINATDSFLSTSNATTFNALRGAGFTAADSGLTFEPIVTQHLIHSNSESTSLAYSLTDKSSLSISGRHSILNYGSIGLASAILSNQQSGMGSLTYKRQTGRYETWSAGYTGTYLQFSSFNNVISQQATVGYANRLPSGLTLSLTVGSSFLNIPKRGASQRGFTASASLTKTIQSNSFSLAYSQGSGEASGLGTVSETRRATLGVSRAWHRINTSGNVAIIETKGQLSNSINTRGASATANIGFPVTRNLSIQVGGAYQKTYLTALGFTQTRLFMTLKFNKPDMWMFRR